MDSAVGRGHEPSAANAERWKALFAEIFGAGVMPDLSLRLRSLRSAERANARFLTRPSSSRHFSLRPELLARD